MMGATESQELIDGVFEDLTLSIGGLIHSFNIPDAFTWRLFQSMESLREKAREVSSEGSAESIPVGSVRPHPAAEMFLKKLRGVE